MLSIFLKKELDNGKASEELLSRHSWHKAWTISKYYVKQSSDYAKDKNEDTKIYKNIAYKWWINFWLLKMLRFGFKKVFDTVKQIFLWDDLVQKSIKLCLDEIYIKWSVYTVLSWPFMKKMLSIQYWTKAEKIVKKLLSLPRYFIKNVTQVAIDMSPTMAKIVSEVFVNAKIVIDRFHIRFNINELLKDCKNRIKKRISKANPKIKRKRWRPKKWTKKKCRTTKRYGNGETKLEIITRVHYQILKNKKNRSLSEKRRRKVIFGIQSMKWLITTYEMTQELYNMYEDPDMNKNSATRFLKDRIKKARKRKKLEELQSIANMIEKRIDYVTNYFLDKHSNWYGEWQNQRIRRFVFDNKWFINDDYMIFRLTKAFW